MTTFTVRRSRVRSTDLLRAQFTIYQGSVSWTGAGVWSTQPIKKANGAVAFTGTINGIVAPLAVRHGTVDWVGAGRVATVGTRYALGSIAWSGSLLAATATTHVVHGSIAWVASGTFHAVSHAVFDCRPGPGVLHHYHTVAVSHHAKTVAVLNCP